MSSSFDQLARCIALGILLGAPGLATGVESMEFVGEHLPEIAMDNRYASLPLWGGCERARERRICTAVSAGYALTHSGTLSIDGPMFAASMARAVGERGKLTAFVFFDTFALSGGDERRPLEVLFTNPPLALPADALFTGLDGRAQNAGLGFAFNRAAHPRWLPAFEWSAGVLWQRVSLTDYAFDYQVLSGPDQGVRGTLDYSAGYSHFTPFVGAAWPRQRGAWGFVPHLQLAVPRPQRGVAGRITGPSFELAGDTDRNGRGKHFGDPSFTAGFDFTYLPWNLTVDLGSTLSQATLEPLIHEGVKHNWFVSVRWQP